MVTTYEFSAKCVVVGLTSLLIGRAGIHKRELDGEREGRSKGKLKSSGNFSFESQCL